MSGSSKKTLNDAVESALARIAARFDELNVPYAVLGAVALSRQGYRRYTEDVDILVRGDDLKAIHGALVGHGYRPVFAGSKNLRDTTDGVKVEFVRAGDYPGDGEEKPISFPDPTASQESHDSIHFVDLRTLVELKLASGMTSTDRLKDLADVQELIQARLLPREFAQELHEYVREKYLELWDAAFGRPKKYVLLWRNKWLTSEATTVAAMADALEAAAAQLRAMLADGVQLDPEGGTSDDYAHLFSTDPTVARKYDMHEESEFFDGDDDP